MKNIFILLIIGILPLANKSFGQDALSVVGPVYVTPENGQGYMEPLMNTFNAGLASNWFAHHEVDTSFHFYIGVSVFRSFIPDNYRTFSGITAFPGNVPQQSATVPTIFGDNESVVVEGPNGAQYLFPGGFDYNHLTLAAPQIQFGGFLNSEVTFRFLTWDIGNEWGKFTTFGVGLQHKLSQYFGLENFDVRIGAAYQFIETGDWLDADMITVQAQGGQQIGKFNYYLNAGWSSFRNTFSYLAPETGPEDVRIDVDTDSMNNFFLGVGAGVKLAVVKFHAEVYVLNPVTVSLGVGIDI
jgi:hypothetical protein